MYLGDGQLCVREMHGINDRKRESRCPEFCKREVIPQSVLWLQWTRYSHSKTNWVAFTMYKYIFGKNNWIFYIWGHYVLIRTKSICCISSVLKVYLFLSILIRLFQFTVKWRLKTIMTLLNSKKKIMNKKIKKNKKTN